MIFRYECTLFDITIPHRQEEVIAKYHKPLIEGYIRREFSRPEKHSAALSLIENTSSVT